MKKKFTLVLALLIFSIFSHAGQIHAAYIGENVENKELKGVFNEYPEKISVKAFKGKLVILDFGNVGCSGCVSSLKKMNSLREKFKSKLEIFWMTDDNKEVLKHFKNTNKIGRSVQLPMVAQDTENIRFFQHKYIPFEVWIKPDGTVGAFTDDSYVDSAHIEEMLLGKANNWPRYQQLPYDYSKNIIVPNADNISEGRMPENPSYIYFSGIFPGIAPRYTVKIDSSKQTITRTFINWSILQMYESALHLIDSTYILEPSYSDIHVKDSATLYFNKSKEYFLDWTKHHTFCYETIFPMSENDSSQGATIILDLNRHFDLSGKFEYRRLSSWILTIDNHKKKIDETLDQKKSNTKMELLTIAEFLDRLNNMAKHTPAIDETKLGFNGVNTPLLDIAGINPYKIAGLNKYLHSKRLKLLKANRVCHFFTLTGY